jgi:enoyl-CoA hydratase/carnithine racemase
MKVLVIGSGGREHALVWKLRQSPRVSKVYCAPGNGGIADEAECLPADVKNLDSLLGLAHQVRPDLTVIGPELPLQMGVVDELTRRGFRVFGPTKAAARLESSKSFAKEFLQRHRIPTAHYAICNSVDDIHKALPHFHTPLVVKADGLAAGKGVVICKSKEETTTVAAEMLSGKMLGEAGTRVVVEECLQGEELSGRFRAEFAKAAAATIRAKSPTSLKLALAQMRTGATLSFQGCMQTEFRIVSRVIHGHDFYEGVRAVIVDKDNAPNWRPGTLADVSDAEIARHFAPLPGGEWMAP